MDKQTETEIRAQSMINSLGSQRLEAFDRCVYVAAELAIAEAKIIELQNELSILKPKEPADGT